MTLVFLAQHTLPSDPARVMAGAQARPDDVARIRVQLGLDRPLWVQYGAYMGRLVRGDLGTSFQRRQPVSKVLAERLPNTIMLALAATTLQVTLGAAAGILAALRRGRLLDHGTIALTLVGISAPTFLTGLLLQYWLAYRLRWLPLDGIGASSSEQLRSLVLPALTLGLSGAAYYARFVRDEMIVILNQDYVRTAIAKGLPRWRVVMVHGASNALMPLLTIIGMDLGAMMGGAIVTEKLFRWPGIGSLSVDAVLARDAPLVMGIVLITSVAIVTANLVVDLLYAVLDPRVRRAR
jgi:ABC-type dipeptide/oligopeptide/nickel transport system permease component